MHRRDRRIVSNAACRVPRSTDFNNRTRFQHFSRLSGFNQISQLARTQVDVRGDLSGRVCEIKKFDRSPEVHKGASQEFFP